MAPGWTNYNKTLQYQVFDVTNEVKDYNTVGFVVGPGWYSGYLSPQDYNTYGDEEQLLFELHVRYFNGTKEVIKSDNTWKVTTGPLIYSDLIHGEVFYENRQRYDWLNYGYDDSNWTSVTTQQQDRSLELVPELAEGITTPHLLVTVSDYWKTGNNTWVYEFDKLVTGTVDLRLEDFPFTARIQVRYSEAIYPNGSLYTGAHGRALVTDTFVMNGKYRNIEYTLLVIKSGTPHFELQFKGGPRKQRSWCRTT